MFTVMTDTKASLPPELAAQKRIQVVPGTFRFLDSVYADSWDGLDPRAAASLWSANPKVEPLSPGPQTFASLFHQLRQGGQGVVCVTPARELCRTYDAAAQARQGMSPDLARGVSVVDSGAVGMAQGLLALAAAETGTHQEAVHTVQRLRDRVQLFCVVESLRRVVNSGLLPGAAAWAERGLRERGILRVARGQVEFMAAVPSMQRAVERLVKLLRVRTRFDSVRAAVMYTDCLDEAQDLGEALVAARFRFTELHMAPACPSLAALAGPGALGVAFYAEE